MADNYSQLFQDDPELMERTLAAYDQSHPEVQGPSSANAYGAVEPGNIDLSRRPWVQNEDGSVSTVRSMGINMDGKEYLIPTVSDDGRVMSDDEAVDEFRRSGRHLGVYDSPEASTAAAEAIHRDQEANPPDNTLAGKPGDADMRFSLPASTPRGSLKQQSQQITNERVDSLNQQGESFAREGEAKALGASRAADIYGKAAISADRYAQAAEQAFNSDQERAAKYKQYEDEDFERLRQEPPKPGMLKNAFNVITGIIGAAAGGTTADAIGMLRSHVNRQAEQDVQERAAAQQRLGMSGHIHDSIIRDSSNALDASAKLVANQWLVASRQLEQIANESSVPVFREQALRLKMAAEDQARGILGANINEQMKAAAQRAAMMRPKWNQFTEGELAALEASGKLPAEGATVLAELRKKKRDASGEGEGGAMKAEAAKALRLYESAGRDADTMRDALAKMDAKNSDDVPGVGALAGRMPDWATSAEGTKLRRATRRLIKTMIRDESGAAISDEEADGFMEDRGMGLTATNADFKVGMQEVLQEFEQKRALVREAAGKGKASAAPEGSEARSQLEAALGMVPRGGR